MSLLANSNAIESGGYNIDRSLRFRSSASAYLNRTFGTPTNNKIYTISGWTKLGKISALNRFMCTDQAAAPATFIYFDSNAQFNFYDWQGGASNYVLTGAPVYRDPSAWYHVVIAVDTTQSTDVNRVKVYFNGTQITLTASGSGWVPQNTNTGMNSAKEQNIGRSSDGNYFDGYMAEFNFIDGQALTPSSFGETSTETGVWVPKKYTGTYGTNGFYLPFTDNTSATTLAYDKSGNGNNWTANNISTTAGATYDSMTDVPTLTSATAANFCVLNPLSTAGGTFADGNLTWTSPATDQRFSLSTFDVTTSGKWYCEMTIGSKTGTYWSVGVFGNPQSATPRVMYRSDGGRWIDGTQQSGNYASYTTGDVIGISYDSSTGSVSFYKNNALQGSMTVTSTSVQQYFACGSDSSGGTMTYYANFGQRPFSYTPPTGFNALNTFNLPDPTIKKPNQYMDATIWTGDGTSTRTITNAGGFQPDFIWEKTRSAAEWHLLEDSVRTFASNKVLYSNSTDSETSINYASLYGYISGTTSTGFTVANGSTSGDYVNKSGTSYVAWQWKKGATPGFDIVTYTGNGGSNTVNHSLGVAPSMLITKQRNTAGDWCVYTKTLGWNKRLVLNATAAADNSGITTDPTSTSFYWNASTGASNTNGTTYVAYLFAEIPGFSKFGSYTGNGSADGPFVYCGFRPKYVMIKDASAANGWAVFDTSRNTYNVTGALLQPNASDAEINPYSGGPDILSNGFKTRGSSSNPTVNTNGDTYIYAAFASNPFKFSNAA